MACKTKPMSLRLQSRLDRESLYRDLYAAINRYPDLKYSEKRYIFGIVFHKLKESEANERDGV